MKRIALMTMGVAGLMILATGCTETKTVYVPAPQPAYQQGGPPAPAPTEVVVQQPPPVAQVEVIPVSPGPAYVWRGGYYYWGGGRWVWAPGGYVVRPHPRAVWVAPRYVRRGGGYVWVQGYWK